ncbi:MAG: hypothetical protein CVT47_01395 [Thermoplasmata archaeon HGW-Thermoplasmata-2]|nr:MAG: hypothetical protein CVT47_01395 [Thermoplasmata archaeon HGW-Thermoplasmata-2]
MGVIRIKDLPESERPREKMLALGPDKLSDKELLAILIGSGTEGKSALDIADEILKKFGGLKGIEGRDVSELETIEGLKEKGLPNILVCYELATRILRETLTDMGFTDLQ